MPLSVPGNPGIAITARGGAVTESRRTTTGTTGTTTTTTAADAPVALGLSYAPQLSAITDGSAPDDLRGLLDQRVSFPDRADCAAAAATIGPFQWDGREGAVPMLEVAPGLVRITAPDLARRNATANRAAGKAPMYLVDRDAAGDLDADTIRLPGDYAGTPRQVTGWSRKSRARMIARLAELDWAPMMDRPEVPAMVTLTYPGNWGELVPDAEVAHAHLTAFFKRYSRAWGESWQGVWKMEFQRRGAVHFHLLMPVPHGAAGDAGRAAHAAAVASWEQAARPGRRPRRPGAFVGDGETFAGWLSAAWADIVGAEGEDRERHERAGTGVDYAEGARARDPRRASMYFAKHGVFADKEYQHNVPELWLSSGKGTGRFWGYRGLSPVREAATMTPVQSVRAARVLRSMSRTSRTDHADGTVTLRPALRRYKRERLTVDPDGTVHARMRWQTGRVQRCSGAQFGAGYLCVQDGPRLARELGRYLAERDRVAVPPVGMRGPVTARRV